LCLILLFLYQTQNFLFSGYFARIFAERGKKVKNSSQRRWHDARFSHRALPVFCRVDMTFVKISGKSSRNICNNEIFFVPLYDFSRKVKRRAGNQGKSRGLTGKIQRKMPDALAVGLEQRLAE